MIVLYSYKLKCDNVHTITVCFNAQYLTLLCSTKVQKSCYLPKVSADNEIKLETIVYYTVA